MIDDGQALDAMLDHQLQHALQLGFGIDGDDLARHDGVGCTGHAIGEVRQDLILAEREHLQGVQLGYHAHQNFIPHDRIGVEAVGREQPVEIADGRFRRDAPHRPGHVAADGFL